MRSRIRLSLALALPLLALCAISGCFSPDQPACAFSCDPTDPVCPGGYECREDGYCHKEGSTGTCPFAPRDAQVDQVVPPPDAGPDGPPDAPLCSETCTDGCCADGVCIATSDQSVDQCGTGGVECAACDSLRASACTDGVCTCGTADECAAGQACDGDTSTCLCDDTSCPDGCCDGDACVTTPDVSACGTGGVACETCDSDFADTCDATNGCVCGSGTTPCDTTQRCVSGACVCNATSCPDGCCDGDTCVTSPDVDFCGTGGNDCAACNTTTTDTCTNGECRCGTAAECGANQACQSGQCICQSLPCCDVNSCSDGCCDNSGGTPACESNNVFPICGNPGDNCTTCDEVRTNRCDSTTGACTCGGTGGPCPTGQHCTGTTGDEENWTCVCDATGCPDGCCDGNGDCQAGDQATACGTGGVACEDCAATGDLCSGAQACVCNNSSCTGCCDTSGDGRCHASSDAFCGVGAAQCVACTTSETCTLGACKKNNGELCTSGTECASGFCSDGVCCNAACTDACDVCAAASGASADGTCTTLSAGAAGSPSCAPYLCDGTNRTCPATCSDDSGCVASAFCASDHTCQNDQANGAACTADSQCQSGHCADGVCCDTACGQACDVCTAALGASADGTCTTAPQGYAGAPSCGAYLCDGTNATCPTSCTGDGDCATGAFCNSSNVCEGILPDGSACTGDGECQSVHCVDGFCCNTACSGSCDVCALLLGASANGVCSPALQGAAGDPSCGTYVCDGTDTACPTSCVDDGDCATTAFCSGGTCQAKQGDGTACTAGNQCTSGNCVDGFCCNTACASACDVCAAGLGASANGTCTVAPPTYGGSPSCGVYLCDGANATCPASCTSDAGCAAGYYCAGSTCVAKQGDGTGCTAENQCTSGNCVDGVCCNTACAGLCEACTAAMTGGTDGTCAAVTAGTDPDTECTDQGAASCGTDGMCNGAGACRLYGSGTECAPQTCTGSTQTGASLCNGTGTCVPGGTTACTPYVCSGNACLASCTGPADCVSSAYCATNNTCQMKLPDGTGCTLPIQCTSGNCVDGVCCNTACGGLCEACTAALTGGTDGTCAAVTAGTDPDGNCTDDGATSCGMDGTCDGAGACRLYASGTVCAASTCTGSTQTNASTCNGSGTCSLNGTTDCAPYVCAGTGDVCLTTCAVDGDCVAGNYCDSGACVLKQDNGTACTAGNQCTSGYCADSVCCNTACDQACDVCTAALGATADGTCKAAPSTYGGSPSCGAYLCDGTNVTCPTTCSSDLECAAGNYCDTDACVPKQNNGTGCTAGNQCTSGYCADSVCCNTACDQACDVCAAALGATADGTCTAAPSTYEGDPSCGEYLCDGTTTTCPVSCASDANCAAGYVCGPVSTCITPQANGATCTDGNQCTSGNCADGVCCNSACNAPCDVCAASLGASADGTCTTAPGTYACGNYLCDGSATTCPTTCADDGDCAGGSYCASDFTCQTKGLCTPTIDGTLGADWTEAAWTATNSVATDWGAGLNELNAIFVCYDANNLYLGIDGVVESSNAIVLYLDRDDGAATGVTDPASLTDSGGQLDNALSASFTGWPATFGAERAWGTVGMRSKAPATTDNRVGLRDITTPNNFGWLDADRTSCSTSACEVQIPWTAIYGGARPAGSQLGLFVRLVNGDGTAFSNQTLPEDAGSTAVVNLLQFAPLP